MIRISSVDIRRFRGVAPNTRLVFGPNHVFLLGPNGAGKTTLLELLARLIHCDLAPFRDETAPVDIGWRLEGDFDPKAGGALALEMTIVVEPVSTNGDSTRAIGVASRAPPRWSVSGRWTLTPTARSSASDNAEPLAQSFAYAWDSEPTFDPPRVKDDGPPPSPFDLMFPLLLAVGFVGPSSGPRARFGVAMVNFAGTLAFGGRRFDEALAVFSAIFGTTDVGPIAEVRGENGRGVTTSFYPRRLRIGILPGGSEGVHADGGRTSIKVAAPPSPDLGAEIASMLGAESIEVLPRLYEANGSAQVWRGFDLYVGWPGGIKHRHDQLSFGQKRLIAFLWYANVNELAPLITDELTNGLHARWVSDIVDLLADRQAIHAVQNPLLLDRVGPGSEEDVPGRFILCTVGATGGAREWHWRNPTATEAHRLRAAWDAGLQTLSEVLLSERLW